MTERTSQRTTTRVTDPDNHASIRFHEIVREPAEFSAFDGAYCGKLHFSDPDDGHEGERCKSDCGIHKNIVKINQL